MIKLEKEQTARFAARLEQETQESVMRDIAQFSEADIVDTWASEPPACAEVHAMVFNMERGVHIDEAIEATGECQTQHRRQSKHFFHANKLINELT